MKRRSFVQRGALATASLLVPNFLKASSSQFKPLTSHKRLIVIQLSGGNDGLNTVVPYAQDDYYRLRPKLALQSHELINLTDSLAFNHHLKPLMPLFEKGECCIVNSVGYPNPNRSHFRSMEIWHTASKSSQHLSTGWLGRYLDSSCDEHSRMSKALEVSQSLSLSLKGKNQKGMAVTNPKKLRTLLRDPYMNLVSQHAPTTAEGELAYLYKTLRDTQEAADYLAELSGKGKPKGQYHGKLGQKLKNIAELILADCDSSIYYASLSGFDTHVHQKIKQGNLLKQYANNMATLRNELHAAGLWKDTLILTFSEFGRRVEQNAGGGTDHGTANNVFLMGGSLRSSGFYNSGPDLSQLQNADLQFEIDFRHIYATVLKEQLGVDPKAVLGQAFETLDFL